MSKSESAYGEIHQIVADVRGRLAEAVGKVLSGEAVANEVHGSMGFVHVPVAKVRAVVFGLMEIAHLLALGDPEGGTTALQSLVPLVVRMPAYVQQVVRAEIARGMIRQPNAVVTGMKQYGPSSGGPIGKA